MHQFCSMERGYSPYVLIGYIKLMNLFKEAEMKQENEIQELKDRLHAVEQQLENRSRGSRLLTTIVIIILAIVLILVLIGILQFVSNG